MLTHQENDCGFPNKSRYRVACDLYETDPHIAIEEMLKILDEGGTGREVCDNLMLQLANYESEFPKRNLLVPKVLSLYMGDGFHVRHAIRGNDRVEFRTFLVSMGLVFLVMIGFAILHAFMFGLPE